jgi:hypothetical protein
MVERCQDETRSNGLENPIGQFSSKAPMEKHKKMVENHPHVSTGYSIITKSDYRGSSLWSVFSSRWSRRHILATNYLAYVLSLPWVTMEDCP